MKKIKRKNILIKLMIFLTLGMPIVVFGQVVIPNPVSISTVPEFLEAAKNFLWILVAPLSTIMMLWAGILFVTSEGNPEKVKKAKTLVTYVVIGVVIALIATGLSFLINDILS